MADIPEQKLPSVTPPIEVKPPGPTAEEMLNQAKTLMAKLTEYGTNAGTILTAINVTATEAKTSEGKIAAGLVAAQSNLAEITNAATLALASKTKITDEEAVIATKSAHINDAQKYADKVRADLDRQLTSATTQATATEAQQAKALAAAESATKELTQVQSTKSAVEAEAAIVAAASKTTTASAAACKNLADKSATIETRIGDYEKRLAEFEKKSTEQLKTIETLLRGATSTGLAYAFDNRRKTFEAPQNRWQIVFVCSLIAIIALTITGWIQTFFAASVPTYEELGRLWLIRLPIAGALIWLALHSSRESALAKRLEEDYGYKSAVASCFEGFRKEMAEISKDASPTSPLAKLCSDTLTTIATPPGRIYDKHKLTVTPSGEMVEAAKAIIAAAGGKT